MASRSLPFSTPRSPYLPLAVIEYDIYRDDPTQSFEVFEVVRSTEAYFRVVVLEIVANWGAASTCLYRVRVHGNATTV